MKKNFLLLFPDGIGFRNFLMTRFMDELTSSGDVLIWHAVPEELVEPYRQQWGGKVRWFSMPRHHEGQLPFINRRAKQLAQLYWQQEPGTEAVISAMLLRTGSGLRGLRNHFANLLARIFGRSSRGVRFLDSMHQNSVLHTGYCRDYMVLLEQEKPDIVFCSHQRSEIAVPVMLAAHKLGIPTATFIYSWDNPPKGRMAVYADYYLVWSQHMKDEMRVYYPDIPEDNVLIVGTPQFEHYFNPAIVDTREIFFAKNNLDPSRPLICFSGDDMMTSPYDQDYLADLAESLRTISEKERPQILFRRNPTGTIDRYSSVLKEYPEINISNPLWKTLRENDWTKAVPMAEDTHLLVNIVNHSDLVVNVASTMALDFAILDKPAVYLRYAPKSWNENDAWNIEQVYQYPHYEHFKSIHPVSWVFRREKLADIVITALKNPGELSEERKKWVEFLVQTPLDQASQRCADALRQIAGAA